MRRCTWLWLVGILVFAVGCEQELGVAEEEGVTLEMQVTALDSNCSSDGNAPAITKYRVRVMDNSREPAEAVADVEFAKGQKVLTLNKIPESMDLELTLLGLDRRPQSSARSFQPKPWHSGPEGQEDQREPVFGRVR